MKTPENTTAVMYPIGQHVRAKGPTKSAKLGKIIGIIPPFGSAGEWSYVIAWQECDAGSGWTDADIAPIL